MFYYIRVVIYPMAVYAGSDIGLACSTAVQLMQVLLDLAHHCYCTLWLCTHKVFSWLQKPVIVCCDQTDCGSLFHSVGEVIAKPRLSMAFLGQTEERESRFPRVRLLVLIKDDKYVGWEN